jgi:non-ribosomal peptide synthetase component F
VRPLGGEALDRQVGCGGSLRVGDLRRARLDGTLRLMEEARVTVYNSVPAALRSLLRSRGAGRAFGAVRVVRVGGDVVFWSDAAELRRRLPPSSHIQIGFSSTEATGTQWFVPTGARTGRARLLAPHPPATRRPPW